VGDAFPYASMMFTKEKGMIRVKCQIHSAPAARIVSLASRIVLNKPLK
jgi:hypothetical protein